MQVGNDNACCAFAFPSGLGKTSGPLAWNGYRRLCIVLARLATDR